MNVLLINYELPPLGGGGGRATLRLAREFAALDHEVLILTSAFKRLPKREERDGVLIRRIRTLRRRADRCTPLELLSFAFSAAAAASRVCTSEKLAPDVVGAFFSFPSGVPALFLRLWRGAPYVVSLRGSDVPRKEIKKGRLLQIPLVPLSRIIWRFAAEIVSVSEGLRLHALRIAPKSRIEVIPNAVDTECFYPTEKAHDGPAKLLFVGRLRPFKGLQFLLPALADARKELREDLKLDVVGDGPYRGKLERMIASLELGDCVRIHGWVDVDEMLRYYHDADLLVLPSFAEGMPNVVLQSTANRPPLVGSAAQLTPRFSVQRRFPILRFSTQR